MPEDFLADRFAEQRDHLRSVAYRMLGSAAEADDAVQESWLRLSRADASEIGNLGAWLTTVTARVCLNMLRARRSKREEPLDAHIPDPIIERPDADAPYHEAELADSVGLALLVVLETLSPAERLAFVLHDMFAVPFDEIATIVDRTPEAARQLASRGRRRVQGAAVLEPDRARQHREVVDAFFAAARNGDFDALVRDVGSGRHAASGRRGHAAVAGRPRRGRDRGSGAHVLAAGRGPASSADRRHRRSRDIRRR